MKNKVLCPNMTNNIADNGSNKKRSSILQTLEKHSSSKTDINKKMLFLAPMMDVTTPPFILMVKHFGGLSTFELPMIFLNQIYAAPKTIRHFGDFLSKNRPCGVQVCGNGRSNEVIKGAIEILNSYDFDYIDVNSGCPARHTCNSGGGASLMQPHRFNDLKNLINTIIKYSDRPVSVKIRIGWENDAGLKEIVNLISESGADLLTIHGRTAKMGYSGVVNVDIIKKVNEMSKVPVIANGDVYSPHSYYVMKHVTNADGVMIGRAIQHNPRLFSQIQQSEPPKPEDLERLCSRNSLLIKEYNVDIGMDKETAHNGDSKKGILDIEMDSPINKDRGPSNSRGHTLPAIKPGKKFFKKHFQPDYIAPLVFQKEYRAEHLNYASLEEVIENLQVLLNAIESLGDFWNNPRGKVIEMRRNAIWMSKGLPNSTKIRQKLGKIKDWKPMYEYIFEGGIIKDTSLDKQID